MLFQYHDHIFTQSLETLFSSFTRLHFHVIDHVIMLHEAFSQEHKFRGGPMPTFQVGARPHYKFHTWVPCSLLNLSFFVWFRV